MKLCENIRSYRQKKDMTQEQLAEVLGVSVQAVSRWETKATYPDITLLPTIASFFDVSLDDLMGMKEFRDEKDLEAIWDKIGELERNGQVQEAISLIRETLKRFPNNYELLNNLANQLLWCNDVNEEEKKEYLNWAMEIVERILRECTDQRLRSFAVCTRVSLYREMGNLEKAIELAEQLPHLWNTWDCSLLLLYSGKKQREHAKWLIHNLTEAMAFAIQTLADLDFQNEELSIEDRIAIMQKSLDLMELIYDGKDYGHHNTSVAQHHRYIAAMEILIGHEEETLHHLEQAAEYAVLADTLPEIAPYTSRLLNGIVHEEKFESKNYTHSECDELYDKMRQERYDAVRETKKFQAILKKISPCLT